MTSSLVRVGRRDSTLQGHHHQIPHTQSRTTIPAQPCAISHPWSKIAFIPLTWMFSPPPNAICLAAAAGTSGSQAPRATTRTEIPMGEGIRLMDLKSPTPQGVLRLLVLVPGRKNDELGGETRSVGHGHEEKPEKPKRAGLG